VNNAHTITELHTFKMSPSKTISSITLLNSPPLLDQTLVETESLQMAATDRFLINFQMDESKPSRVDTNALLEFNSKVTSLHMLESPSTAKEHEFALTGIDYLRKMKLLVTADRSGCIRLWTDTRKFLREIVFPPDHPINSVCFYNAEGDLLVSHKSSLSLIKFERYWTPTFSHYGVTDHDHPCYLKH
jgi:hypothetical protein